MNIKKAWYLDDGILLEGSVLGNKFYPDSKLCGFDFQEFDDNMINKEIFYDLEKAVFVCGNVPVIKE